MEIRENRLLFILSGVISCVVFLTICSYLAILFAQKADPNAISFSTKAIAIDMRYLPVSQVYAPKHNKADENMLLRTNPFAATREVENLKNTFKNTKDASIKADEVEAIKQVAANVKKKDTNKGAALITKSKELSRLQASSLQKLQEKLSSLNENITTLYKPELEVTPLPANRSDEQNKIDSEWIKKIYAIIYKNWHIRFKEKASLRAIIVISSSGGFSYSVQTPSPYPDFNTNVENLLDYLSGLHFTPHPSGRDYTIAINFKTKEDL